MTSTIKETLQAAASSVATAMGETLPDEATLTGERTADVGDLETPHFLASYLHYEAYDECHQHYRNREGVAAVFEISPCIGASDDMVLQLTSLIQDGLPETAITQCLLYASPKIMGALSHWYQTRSQRGGPYQTIASERIHHLANGVFNSLLGQQSVFLRDFRIILSVQLPGFDESVCRALSEIQSAIKASFSAIGAKASPLEPAPFLGLIRSLVHPTSDLTYSPVPWESSRPLRSQCVPFGSQLRVTPSQLLFNEAAGKERAWVARTFSVESLPSEWHQAQMSQLLGHEDKSFLQQAGCFCINLVFKKYPPQQAKKRMLVKSTRSEQMANSLMSKLMPRVKLIARDWQQMKEAMDVHGAEMVHVLLQAAVFAPPSHIDKAQAALNAVFLNQGWRLTQDKHLCLQAFLTLLPMQVSPALFRDAVKASRTRTLSTLNVAHLMPLQGEWKGVGQPALLLAGRRGQVCWFDPFANQSGNYNLAVTGKSRSGKSVLLQDMAAAIVGSGGRTFIFDIGRSFEKSCRLLGGEFIEFTRDTTLSLNPFTHIENFQDSVAMLTLIFAAMVSQTRVLTEVESALLEEALKASWQQHLQACNVTLVANWLRNHEDKRAQDLGLSLYPYTREGQFGHFFEGPCTLNFDNPYIVLELEELKSMKSLQTVVLMLLMYHVTDAMYHGGRKQRILCIIDEAWDLLGGQLGGQFIETGYRRAAKYLGAFAAGTQGLADFDKSPAARACKENADTLMILSQKQETIERAEKDDTLDMTPHLKKTLKSVKTLHEAYAELCIKTDEGYSVQRLYLDPFSTALFSSKGPVHAEIDRLRQEEHLGMDEAVRQVAQRLTKGEFQ